MDDGVSPDFPSGALIVAPWHFLPYHSPGKEYLSAVALPLTVAHVRLEILLYFTLCHLCLSTTAT